MKYRTLGKTNLTVSELGFGGWGIGGDWWSGADDKQSIASLEKAKELGVTFFDSALGYGNGHSEQLIGSVIRGDRDAFVITSKIPPKNFVFTVPPNTPVGETYPKEWIISCTEQSLRNYGVEYLDVQQFHVWINSWGESEELLRAVEDLKKSGKVRSFGCSINFPFDTYCNAVPQIKSGLFETIQIVYNIYEQDPQKEVLPTARQYNAGVIVRCPLDEGSLTGNITAESRFPQGSFLDTYFQGERKRVVYEKARALHWLIDEGYVENLSEAAIRFVLSHPAVSSTIVGMRNPKHTEDNCRAIDKGPLPQEVLARLKEHAWHHNYWE